MYRTQAIKLIGNYKIVTMIRNALIRIKLQLRKWMAFRTLDGRLCGMEKNN